MPSSVSTLSPANAATGDQLVVDQSAPQNATTPIATATRALTCTNCGGDNALDSRFCRHCGATLRAATPAESAAPTSNGVTTSDGAAADNAAPSNAVSGNGHASNGDASNSSTPISTTTYSVPMSGDPTTDAATPTDTVAAPNGVAEANGTSADSNATPATLSEVDRKRARNLLDRASRLNERGDVAGAISAVRQAVSLHPELVGGHAMLGALLERTGDTEGATESYERVLQLFPDSPLERERLRLLRAGGAQSGNAPRFRFDDAELFPATPPAPIVVTPLDTSPDDVLNDVLAAPVSAAPVAPAPLASAASTPSVLLPVPLPVPATSLTPTPVAVAPVTSAPVAVVGAAPSVAVVVPVAAAATLSAPVAAPLPPSPSRLGASAMNASLGAAGLGAPSIVAPPIAPLTSPNVSIAPELRANANAVSRDRSFFWRGAPLAATVGTGLIFTLWAANWSAARRTEPLAPTPVAPINVAPAPVDTSANPNTNAGAPRLTARDPGRDPFVGSAPGVVAPNVAAPNVALPRVSAPVVNTRPRVVANNVRRVQNGRRVTVSGQGAPQSAPFSPLPPSGLAPAPVASLPSAPLPNLPAPSSGPSVDAPPVSTGDSSGTTGASTGGAPLAPGTSSNNGYISLSRRRNPASAPVRPSSQANTSERDASNAARQGQGNRAVQDATNAIARSGDNDRDLGWRYQNRALLFLEQGDNARASDDFQSAISAYQAQLGRNDQPDAARAGISACRRGLRLALSRQGR